MSPAQPETRWREALESSLISLAAYPAGSADGLYDPIHYLLSLGGKRIRPVLALAVCEAEGGSVADAMPAAMAVELFHNFTLMHDDIMDEAAPAARQTHRAHQMVRKCSHPLWRRHVHIGADGAEGTPALRPWPAFFSSSTKLHGRCAKGSKATWTLRRENTSPWRSTWT